MKTNEKKINKKLKSKEKKWLTFEEVIAKAYTAFHSILNPSYIVKHNDFIDGYFSKTPRQIDISIKGKLPDGNNQLIIVSAKHYSSPASIPKIDELWGVMNDIKATKGILICKGGFTKNTIVYARNLGIDLCSIKHLENLSEGEIISIPTIFIYYDKPQFEFEYDLVINEELSELMNSATFVYENKVYPSLAELFVTKWNLSLLEKTNGEHIHPLKDIDIVIGNHTIPLENFDFKYTVNKRGKIDFITPDEYYSLEQKTRDEKLNYFKIKRQISFDKKKFQFLSNIDELEKGYPGLHIKFTFNSLLNAKEYNKKDFSERIKNVL